MSRTNSFQRGCLGLHIKMVGAFVLANATAAAATLATTRDAEAQANTATVAADIFQPHARDVRDRIVYLRAEITRHDVLYHQKAAPEISDTAYDQLKRELQELETASPNPAARMARSPELAMTEPAGFHRGDIASRCSASTKRTLKRRCGRSTRASQSCSAAKNSNS